MKKDKLLKYTNDVALLSAKLARGQISKEEHSERLQVLVNGFLREHDGLLVKVPFIHR